MGRVDENKARKRTALMESAFDLFTHRGVAKTTVDDITQNAGVAKGTFYLYFRDKYDLQENLVAEHSEKILEHALEYSGYREMTGLANRITAITDDILKQFTEDELLLRFIDKNLSWGVFKNAMIRSGTDFAAVAREIFQSGQERQRDIQITVYMILELVNSTCVTVILEQDPIGFEEYLPWIHRSVEAIVRSFEEAGQDTEG